MSDLGWWRRGGRRPVVVAIWELERALFSFLSLFLFLWFANSNGERFPSRPGHCLDGRGKYLS
jgi:hypothetical protein